MTHEQMKNFLVNAHNESIQTKMLNSLIVAFEEIDKTKVMILELQEKINRLEQKIDNIQNNHFEGTGDIAEALNYDMLSDSFEQDFTEEDVVKIDQESDALVD